MTINVFFSYGFIKWFHIRHLNLVKTHPERITKEDKKMINDLDYERINFPVSKKDYGKTERQNNICINFVMKMD